MASDDKGRGGGVLNIILAGAAGIGLGAAGMLLFGQSGISEDRVAGIVKDTLMAEPEILPKAMKELERKQSAAAVEPRRADFETPYGGAWAGAQDGDVTLVAFFDYACGFCRRSNEALDRLLQEDPKLKIVWRELPVLGPGSQQAAFASLAAAEQGKYRPFYHAMFEGGPPNPATIERAAAAAGVQPAAPTPRQQAEIRQNMELATLIGANGTPTFVVGETVLHGAVPYEELKAAVATARARRAS